MRIQQKHGMKHTRLYNIFMHMKRRCYNPKMQNYKWYGAKGIKVCEEWKNDFIAFHKWAMSNGYNDSLSIERKDTNKDYCPKNCCWIPMKQQNRNKITTIKIIIFGEEKIAADWARDARCTVTPCHFYWRIKKGMNPELALTLPPEPRVKNFKSQFKEKYL